MNKLSPETQDKIDTRQFAIMAAEFAVDCRNSAPDKTWFWRCLAEEIERLCDSASLPPQERTIGPDLDPHAFATGTPRVELQFADADEEVAEAVEQCDRIIELCQELPERAEDFGMSIIEKAEGIRKTIVETDRVTVGQKAALVNMEAGVSAWVN